MSLNAVSCDPVGSDSPDGLSAPPHTDPEYRVIPARPAGCHYPGLSRSIAAHAPSIPDGLLPGGPRFFYTHYSHMFASTLYNHPISFCLLVLIVLADDTKVSN